jgi:hypothetical protein
VGWSEDKFKAPGLGGKEAPGLSRTVGGVIVEQHADQHANPIGGVELLQEGDELAAAVALSDGMVDNTGHEVYSGREGHGAEPPVFVIALHGGMLARLGRQIGGSGGNRLDAGLLVVREDGDGTFRFGQRPQHFGRRIDLDDFGLALSECRIAAVQIVAYLVGLDRLFVQNVVHRAGRQLG